MLTASPHPLGSNVTVISNHIPEAGRKQSEGSQKLTELPVWRVSSSQVAVGWAGEVCAQSPQRPCTCGSTTTTDHQPVSVCTLLLVSWPHMKLG